MLFGLLVTLLLAVESSNADCQLYMEETRSLVYYCHVKCDNVGWNDGIHPGHAAGQLAAQMPDSCEISMRNTLQFLNCSFPNNRLEVDWFTTEPTPDFNVLQFDYTDLQFIADDALSNYNAFNKTLESLNLFDTPSLSHITKGLVNDISSPRVFSLFWHTGGVLKTAQVEAIAQLSPDLTALSVSTQISDLLTIANMTGICQTTDLNKLQQLTFRELTNSSTIPGQGIHIFGKSLISAVSNSSLLYLTLERAGIEYFEDNTAFAPVASNYLKQLYLVGNLLKNIPDGLFQLNNNLNFNIKIYLNGNPWHCDGNLLYLQNLLKNDTDNLIFDTEYIVCASPDSQAGKLVIDADLSGVFEPLPPVPRLNITCN